MLQPHWDVMWLRLAEESMRRDNVPHETIAAIERLEEKGYEQPFNFAFAELLERI